MQRKKHWIDFNLNDNIRVQLTDHGRKIHRENHEKFVLLANNAFPYQPPVEDADGWSEWQMWVFIMEFGEHIRMGTTPPCAMDVQIQDGWGE